MSWQLQAGDYWLVFEGSAGTGSGSMPAGAPNPLAGYASSPGLWGAEWMKADTLGFGVRINVEPEPPPIPSVPEPMSLVLLLAGFGVVVEAARRRNPSPLGAW